MSSTNRGAKRNAADFYATPESAFMPLLVFLPLDPVFIEPACGDGRLVKWLRRSGRTSRGSDLYAPVNEWNDAQADFTKATHPAQFVITNPPFSLALEFCQAALRTSQETMLLLRLNFLGSQKRRDWWKENEPNALFVLSERPDFTGGGGDSCEYAWFYWGRRWQGIRHL